MMDRLGQEIAFKGIDLDEAFVPAFSLSPGQQGKLNFGQVRNILYDICKTPYVTKGNKTFKVTMQK